MNMTYYLSTQIFSLLRCFIKYIYISSKEKTTTQNKNDEFM